MSKLDEFQMDCVVDAYGDNDVLGTKTNLTKVHPGNIFYRQLVDKMSKKKTGSDEQKWLAVELVDEIYNKRGGRFLKQTPSGRWEVLNRCRSENKAILAFKNAQYKLSGYPEHMSKTKGEKGTQPISGPRKRKEPPKSKTKESHKSIRMLAYQARQGNTTIHPYTLAIISKVATEIDPDTAIAFLDEPIKKGEEHLERLIRLKLRHRYYAAWDGNMAPRTFSRKLMKFWGGELVEMTLQQAGLERKMNAVAISLTKQESFPDVASTRNEPSTGLALDAAPNTNESALPESSTTFSESTPTAEQPWKGSA